MNHDLQLGDPSARKDRDGGHKEDTQLVPGRHRRLRGASRLGRSETLASPKFCFSRPLAASCFEDFGDVLLSRRLV